MDVKSTADSINNWDNVQGCKMKNTVKGFFDNPKDKKKETFENGMYALDDCRIVDERCAALEHGELKKEEVSGIVLHQTNGQTAFSTLARYHKDNVKNYIVTFWNSKGVDALGAHFLVAPDGTMYQTARIDRVCYHVGPYINSPCFEKRSCRPEETGRYEMIMDDPKLNKYDKWAQITAEEIKKNWQDRYSRNTDSIGIEVVGMPDERGIYQHPSGHQTMAVNWLVDLLMKYFNLSCDRIFAHGQVSPHKNPTEGMSILSATKNQCGKITR